MCYKRARVSGTIIPRVVENDITSGFKLCVECGRVLPIAKFKGKEKARWHHPCYQCCKLHDRYRIPYIVYEILCKLQSYSCAICNIHQSNTKTSLFVDHDHLTGKIRGLLCDPCNRGIGAFEDSYIRCENAIVYLQKSDVLFDTTGIKYPKDKFMEYYAPIHCQICLSDLPSRRQVNIDHDHSCCISNYLDCKACIRGFLCRGCNTGLGMMYDSIDRLDSAAKYLRKYTV